MDFYSTTYYTRFYTRNVPKLPCAPIVYTDPELLEFEDFSWELVMNADPNEQKFSPSTSYD